MKKFQGSRKLILGMTYILGAYVIIALALCLPPKADAGVIAAVAGAITTTGAGLLGVIWGNTREYPALNGSEPKPQ